MTEYFMVFKYRKAGKDAKLLRRWLNAGWTLMSENSDRFYFGR